MINFQKTLQFMLFKQNNYNIVGGLNNMIILYLLLIILIYSPLRGKDKKYSSNIKLIKMLRIKIKILRINYKIKLFQSNHYYIQKIMILIPEKHHIQNYKT